jgi:hypothetical protein
VKGAGLPGRAAKHGDLLVTVDVVVPNRADRRAAQGGRGARRAARSVSPRDAPRECDGLDEPPATRRPRAAVYVISVAAELAGVHPQTLRIYERKGLLDPARTGGGNRRYSDADIAQLRASRS